MMSDDRRDHWNKVFATKADQAVSCYQPYPATSLRLIHACNLPKNACILDVGAGASRLPDALLDEGFSTIAVLDVSAEALAITRARLAERSD